MSQRIPEGWTVLRSLETEAGDRCVDLFRRPDGSFGFESFRRDPEDGGRWTPVAWHLDASFASLEAALSAARAAVAWLEP